MTETKPKLSNRQVAEVFRLIGDLMDIQGENVYKILAYRRAADSISSLPKDINEVWKAGELQEIPGIGKAIAEKIDELLSTGHLGFLERLSEEVPLSLAELLKVPEIGPKKASTLWRQAGIATLEQLEEAAQQGKLRNLPGIGEKSEARILAGIQAFNRRTNRTPLGDAYPKAKQLVDWLRKQPDVTSCEMAGSLRRMRATIGDIDLVAAVTNPQSVMQAFIDHPLVEKVYMQGGVKVSVELRDGLRAQLWLHPPQEWGTALQYATGSKEHSVRLRELAVVRGCSLSDHSIILEDGQEQFFSTEESLYQWFGMDWVPPELREDRGEIQAALDHHLPHLIEKKDIRGDLHNHSTWSDGQVSIKAMADAARERGYDYIGITDHTSSLGIVRGMKPEDVRRQREEIDQVQKELGNTVRLLQGAEVEILADGSLDYPDEVLSSLDFVIASLHSGLRQPRDLVTERLVKAMRNRHVDIIGHPTGRLIPDREGADLDMEVVLQVARETGVALEINAHPSRLDLEDIYARRAVDMGIPLSINTDAHAPDGLDLMFYGVSVARRGWIEAKHVINTWPAEKLIKWLTQRGA